MARKPPTGLSRLMFRAPIWLYRAHLGGLLGGRFILLHHIGRTSGLPREAVVEVVAQPGECFVICSGFGTQSQWYRNVVARPDIDITTRNRRIRVHARELTTQQAEEQMADYTRRHPRAAKRLADYMGFSGPDASARVAAELPFLELCPR
ncbi:MAG: nitroreductase family deazaflavin-dependent oxidoreductase [Actinobacteria bacterium]|nr:nitroreductase family deazaflavin-dependent oxidoreductase [Actinomycetota bacterium]MCB9423978.1 nitroreductase family deazaflavin-dependent oxidoreductase [Actinomycetota bacterium]